MMESKAKLDKEMCNLALLQETANKSNQLTKGMCNILTSFDERLMKLEQTILPVYQETGNLQRRQENTEKTLEKLDYVIQFYNVSKEAHPILRDGPEKSLGTYLAAMQKLENAIKFFSENNRDSPELAILNGLFDDGGEALEKEFRSLLFHHSRPVPPITILDLVGFDDELTNEDEKPVVEHLPEKVIKDLIQIAEWLRWNKNEDFTSVYAIIRSNILQKSLQGLKDHQKSCSGNSNTLTAQNSPLLGGRRNVVRDTPPRRPSKRIQQAFFLNAIRRRSPTVENTVLGQRLQIALLPEQKDEIPEHEILACLTSVSALHKLMQSELQLMQGVIPPEQQKGVFERVVLPALDSLISEGENLISRVKKCVARHEFPSVLNLFPVLRHLTAMKPEFDILFQGCTQTLQNKLSGLVITLQTTISKGLEEFIDSIRNDPDTKMPKDGTVHEMTSNVMMLLEQLQGYLDTLGTVLTLGDVASQTTCKDPNKSIFAHYITRVLSALGLALQNKSESYNDPYLKAVFRLNNLHYILKSLQRTNLLDIVHLHNSNVESYYTDLICDQKRIYSQSWSRVLHYVMEVDKPFSQQRTVPALMPQSSGLKLKDKDRQNIKDKFTGFNKEMEEICRIQKAYAIPDDELRKSLKCDNKEYILPKYTMFYEKYANVQFTKNPEKYQKYTPRDVSDLIDKFFDAAA